MHGTHTSMQGKTEAQNTDPDLNSAKTSARHQESPSALRDKCKKLEFRLYHVRVPEKFAV